ncbi:MAG: trypsin-like peptidase domain-containing protein [Thermoguttaceae bacterium]|jgi:serine protease Do
MLRLTSFKRLKLSAAHHLGARPLIAISLGILCYLALPVGLLAQNTIPASLEHAKTLTPERQAELRQELQRQLVALEAQSAVMKTVAKLVGPSVVFIESQRGPDASRRHLIQEDGSGVIIKWKEKFYVLTNRHVVRDTPISAIKIDLADGRRIAPDKVLGDEECDVAILAVSAPDLVAAPLGDSDNLEIGDFVMAMGSPFGLNQSFSHGIISGKGRRNLKLGESNSKNGESNFKNQDFLQTDAPINPGNSGGPLVNMRGEVIGINTAIASNSGVSEGCGFAIPINMFMFSAGQLIETGKVIRGYIGVQLNSRFGPEAAAEAGLPRLMGAKISAVTPRTPAETAKLLTGDIILEFNHIPIDDDGQLVNVVSMTDIGATVPVLIFRNRQTQTVEIEVQDHAKYPQ